MLTILHTSDLQIGTPFLPDAAEAVVRTFEAVSPDVVVVAGDLTQRAKAREFRVARELLERFEGTPVVVTPGNHDVPLYRAWERIAAPYRNWKRFISPELDTVTRIPGATIVALNSSAPRSAIVGGRLAAAQLSFARAAFAQSGANDVRVVVTHHHFVVTDDRSGGRPLRGARELLGAFASMGVDLVLGGHVHQTRVIDPGDPATSAPFPVVSCGTTTSRRGRGAERGLNTLNVVRIASARVRVESCRYIPSKGAFQRFDLRLLERRSSRVASSNVTSS